MMRMFSGSPPCGLGEELLDFVLQHVVVGERLGDAVDVEQDAGRGRRGGDDDDHERGQREAPPEALRASAAARGRPRAAAS